MKRIRGRGGGSRRGSGVLVFKEEERREFLTGFHKRKVERRKKALEEIKVKLKEEQKRVKDERHKEYVKMFKERQEALAEADELDQLATSKVECVQYDHPNHTVTVTTVSSLDLTAANLFNLGANQNLFADICPALKCEKSEGEEVERFSRSGQKTPERQDHKSTAKKKDRETRRGVLNH
ncbi:nucleolar protein 12-like isoform X2 [Scyliorhinus canicula]|uniref:nucleolar protein 12-like isoform X2 n=1 Tax=Scyliorhinus canicula TaxID=7830 RepID=UPI0018F5294B|nr:nucleolar protein 12-like isoform X2 [Scyliorhinus canicula]